MIRRLIAKLAALLMRRGAKEPDLWNGLEAAWIPSKTTGVMVDLVSGETLLVDASGNGNHAITHNGD